MQLTGIKASSSVSRPLKRPPSSTFLRPHLDLERLVDERKEDVNESNVREKESEKATSVKENLVLF